MGEAGPRGGKRAENIFKNGWCHRGRIMVVLAMYMYEALGIRCLLGSVL